MKRILIIIVWLSHLPTFSQTNHYVSPSGNDDHDGLITSPWKTFQKACDNVSPGDTVFFRGGTYREIGINCSHSGTTLSPIVYTNYAGEVPVFSGSTFNVIRSGFLQITANNVIVSGLKFQEFTGRENFGIKITDVSHNVTLSNLKLSNLYFSSFPNERPDSSYQTMNPILVFGSSIYNPISQITIDNCEISNCRTGQSEAIAIVGNVENYTVSRNTISSTGNIGIVAAGYYKWNINGLELIQTRNGLIKGNIVDGCKSLKALAAGIYIDGAKEVIVEGNICKNGQRGFAVNCENHSNVSGATASNNMLRSNLAYNNSRGGISIGSCRGGDTCKYAIVQNTWVINNTTYNNFDNSVLEPTETTPVDFGELILDASENTRIRNNIFSSTISGRWNLQISNQKTPQFVNNLDSDYNIWQFAEPNWPVFQLNNYIVNGLSAYQNSSGQEQNSLFQNINFKNPSTGDFRLLNEYSPTFDFGDTQSTTISIAGVTDLSGKPRMMHLKLDAGAYEYGCVTSDISINTPLPYDIYHFETVGSINFNTHVTQNQRVTLIANKAINLQSASLTNLGSVFKLEIGGCVE